jgi:hypothetical protein
MRFILRTYGTHGYTLGKMQSLYMLKQVVCTITTLLYRFNEISKLKMRRDEMHVIE